MDDDSNSQTNDQEDTATGGGSWRQKRRSGTGVADYTGELMRNYLPAFDVLRRPRDGVTSGEGEVVGVQTKTVVIPQDCIDLIRSRAHTYWEQQRMQQQQRSSQSRSQSKEVQATDSRFTLFEGNSEVHLADLCLGDDIDDDDPGGSRLKRWID